jgi:hypothetical protein
MAGHDQGGNTIGDLIKPSSRNSTIRVLRPRISAALRYRVGCYRKVRTHAWMAVFDLGDANPSAAAPTGRSLPSPELCAPPHVADFTHSTADWRSWVMDTKILNRNREGHGPFIVKLLSDLPASLGRHTIQVGGEPSPH